MSTDRIAEVAGLTPLGRLAARPSADIDRSPFSLGVECLDRGMWNFDKAFPHIAALGAKWARVQTGWAKCEREPGVYTFEWLDAIVDRLLDAGIQPWFNVGYGNRLYLPDAPHETAVGWTPIHDKDASAAWARFATALAEHYAGRVRHYEVWNEPDIKPFWTPHEPDPKAYVNLVIVTADGLRRGDPEAFVIGGSMARGLSQPGLEFTERCLAAGMAEVIDAFSYHNYAGTPEPRYEKLVPALWALVQRWRPGLPLWQGESGAPSVAVEGQALSNYAWDEDKQARWDLRRCLCDLAAGTPLIAIFHASDFEFYIVKDQTVAKQYYFGLIGAPEYEPKPAYYAIQSLCTLLAGEPRPEPAICPQIGGAEPAVDSAETRAYGFRTDAGPVVAWWQAHDTMQSFEPRSASLSLWMPSDLELAEPVLVEPISQSVWALPAGEAAEGARRWRVPLVDWPLLMMDRRSVPLR